MMPYNHTRILGNSSVHFNWNWTARFHDGYHIIVEIDASILLSFSLKRTNDHWKLRGQILKSILWLTTQFCHLIELVYIIIIYVQYLTLMFVWKFAINLLCLPTEGISERCLKVDTPVFIFHLPYETYNIPWFFSSIELQDVLTSDRHHV